MEGKQVHWLEELTGEYGDWRWLCSCGASGTTRTQLMAGEAFRGHVDEMDDMGLVA